MGDPLCDHEMGFISLRIIKTEAWCNTDMVYSYYNYIRATDHELKPAGCRSYAILRSSDILRADDPLLLASQNNQNKTPLTPVDNHGRRDTKAKIHLQHEESQFYDF